MESANKQNTDENNTESKKNLPPLSESDLSTLRSQHFDPEIISRQKSMSKGSKRSLLQSKRSSNMSKASRNSNFSKNPTQQSSSQKRNSTKQRTENSQMMKPPLQNIPEVPETPFMNAERPQANHLTIGLEKTKTQNTENSILQQKAPVKPVQLKGF